MTDTDTFSADRGLGFLAEENGEFDLVCGGSNRDAGEHLVGSAPPVLPKEALALVEALSPFKDQGSSSTCVSHGIANGAEARLRVLNPNAVIPPSSVRQIYTTSNEIARATKKSPIALDGTYPRVAMKVCADIGVAPDTEWPFRNALGVINNVAKEVPLDVFQRASAWKLKEQFTVYATGLQRVRTVATGLVNRIPFPCAGRVDTRFMNHTGKDVLPAPNPRQDRGGHMVCIIGFRTAANGRLEFLIVNSWDVWGFGPEIGFKGRSLAWVSEGWVMALQEIYGFTLASRANI